MINFWKGLIWQVRAVIIIILLGGVGYFAYTHGLIPGLSSVASKNVATSSLKNETVDIKTTEAQLPVPDINDHELANVEGRPEVRVMNWVWFGTAPEFVANGGLNTIQGSLMDKLNMNVKIITDNSVDNMKAKQLAFINAYHASGDPKSNPGDGVQFVSIMGDGATAYIPAMNKQIRKACGPEYQLKVVGMFGFSLGEDCFIGLPEWKENPQLMKGCVISAVIGDGDWGVIVRFAADIKQKVNPDPDTYDKDAINFVPAPDNDFMKAAAQLFTENYVTLKEKDSKGVLTGKTVKMKINGAATWFPGDKQVFEQTNYVKIASTSQYSNQMACVLVGCDKWMQNHPDLVVNYLSAALTAGNQMKQYDSWFKYATELAPKVFCASPEDCSESAGDWYNFAKPGGKMMHNKEGIEVSAGGTQAANLADNLKYFGVKGGNNYYKSIYEYFNGVLMDLNPAGFKESVGEVTSYEDAVDLRYLKLVGTKVAAGKTTKVDYSENKGKPFASRPYKIEFMTGSATISPESIPELEEAFGSLQNAVKAKVFIVGHTDNQGSDAINNPLSLERARAVRKWLIDRSNGTFPSERFNVDGKGSTEPVADNSTPAGRSKNRRVQFTLTE